MSVSLVGTPTSTTVTGGTSGAVLPGTAQAGDLLVAIVAFIASGSETVTGVTDTLGTSYSQVLRNNGGSLACAYEVWWGVAPAGGSPTITAAWTNAQNGVVFGAIGRSSNGTAWTVNASSSFTETGSVLSHNCAAVGAIDTTVADALLIGGGVAPGNSFPSPASGFTAISTTSSRAIAQYQIVSALQTDQRATYSGTTARSSNNAIVAFAVPVSTASARLSQLPVEALQAFDPSTVSLRLSQAPVEALQAFDPTTVSLRLSQLAIEVLQSPVDEVLTPVEVLLAQMPVEVLVEAAPAADVDATQVVTELAQQQTGGAAVSQLLTEVLHQQLTSTVDVTQTPIEYAWRAAGSQARVTQLLIEIIKVPVAGSPTVDPITGLEPCALEPRSAGCWTPSTPSAACLDLTPDRASAGCWTAFTPATLRVGLLDSE